MAKPLANDAATKARRWRNRCSDNYCHNCGVPSGNLHLYVRSMTLKLNSLVSCAGVQRIAIKSNVGERVPLADNLRRADNSSTSKESADVKRNFSRVDRARSSIRQAILPRSSWESGVLKQVQQKAETWVMRLPEQDRRDLLMNQYTYLTHTHIDSRMKVVIKGGGGRKGYKEMILQAVHGLQGGDGIKSVGGPGLLTQKLKMICGEAGLEVSNKNPKLENSCTKVAREICEALAKDLNICSPKTLERTLVRASHDYFSAESSHCLSGKKLVRTDSLKLLRQR